MASKLVVVALLVLCLLLCGTATSKTYKIISVGYNAFGQLGTNSTTDSVGVPVVVNDGGLFAGKTVQQVAAGRFHSLAIVDSKVYAWGHNQFGQLGDGTTTTRLVPTPVVGELNDEVVTFIAAGGNHSVAVTADGKVYTWGYGGFGQLCHGNLNSNVKTPTQIQMTTEMSNTTVVQLSTGFYDTFMLTADGRLFGCGRNHRGQLGDGTKVDKSLPSPVDMSGALAGKTIKMVTSGLFHTAALDAEGKIYVWGFNDYGQLGDGTTEEHILPIAINPSIIADKQFTDIAIGYHSTALTTTGELFAWGHNGFGQVGDGTTTNRLTPVPVNTDGVLKNKIIDKIDATHNVLARATDGSVFAWGFNRYGMCGNGDSSDQSNLLLPTAVSLSDVLEGGGEVIDMSTADGFHSLFIASWDSDPSSAPALSTSLLLLLASVALALACLI